MVIRSTVTLLCPDCKTFRTIRKDGAGIRCRICQAKRNHCLKKLKQMIGKNFGKLTVFSISHIKKQAFWKCKCGCGNECIVAGSKLRNLSTRSCGCICKRQNGLAKSRSYKSWMAMKERCLNSYSSSYSRYGALGIKICERWLSSFQSFYEDMGERPIGKTLDRLDPFGNYFKENCRWATPSEQGLNKKTQNHLIEYNGQKKPLTFWSNQFGIGWATLRKRIVDLKWPIEKALNTPVKLKKK